MGKTVVSIKGEDFFINGVKTYSEIEGSNTKNQGLLTNARFIQGVFDDKSDSSRFDRYGKKIDTMANTMDLIKALPEWYSYGLRAFTVGIQGGGPCFTIDNDTIENNPYGDDGLTLDEDYKKRLDLLICAADEIGMAVIVSYMYPGQAGRLEDGRAVQNAVIAASRFLKENEYTNVIIEVCNEFDCANSHTLINTDEGMSILIKLARKESGGMLVGCSLTGGSVFKEVCEESDVLLIHTNGCSRQKVYNLIQKTRGFSPGKPVVINEDSQAIGQLEVCFHEHVSWGYYNNMTKQEPPVNWGVTKGEDQFFAQRIAIAHGIKVDDIPLEDQYYLQGLEPHMTYNGVIWPRVASLYPETINYVEFYKNGELYYTNYDEPFSINWQCNWRQDGDVSDISIDKWTVKIFLRDGRIIEK